MNAWIHLSKLERQGIRGLIVLIILSHGLRWWLTEWNKQHAVLKTPNVQWLMESTEGNKNFIPVAFNPNQANDSIWLGFGVSQKGLQSIRKYLAKGGEFRKEEDVARMYCIDSTLFQKMRPFLMFPRRVNQFDRPPSPFRRHDWAYHPTAMRVELNSADTLELRKLPAIGVSIARRIIQYRERLGGYHALHQLLEVY
ncbi:MAG: ComEA family DNA-binding protein, partial [Flavobacteriales bacterium]